MFLVTTAGNERRQELLDGLRQGARRIPSCLRGGIACLKGLTEVCLSRFLRKAILPKHVKTPYYVVIGRIHSVEEEH